MPCSLGLYPFGIRLRFQESTMHLINAYLRRAGLILLALMGLALIASCGAQSEMSPGDSGYAGEVAVPSPTPEPTDAPNPNNFSDLLGSIKASGTGFVLVGSESQMTFQVDDRWGVAREFHDQVGDAAMLIMAGYFQEDGSILICRIKMQEIEIDRCPIARG